jgi:hypothetical protein
VKENVIIRSSCTVSEDRSRSFLAVEQNGLLSSFGCLLICQADAVWVRTRMPNKRQMTHLCQHHYQALQQRNSTLADYYDPMPEPEAVHQWHAAEESLISELCPSTGS